MSVWQRCHFEGHVCVSKHFPHLCHDLSSYSKKIESCFSVLVNLADPEGQIVRRCVGLLRAIDLVTCVLSGEVSTFSAPNCCRRGTQLSLLYFLGATCGYPEASLKEVQSILNGLTE